MNTFKEIIFKIKFEFVSMIISLLMFTACTTLLAPSHKTKGEDYLKQQNYTAAIQELQIAAEEANKSAEYTITALCSFGEAYEKTGKPHFSMIAYNKALVVIQTRNVKY